MRRRRAGILAEAWKLLVLIVTVRIIARHGCAGRGPGLAGWR
ncbi:hypothetical protein [Caulobacter sp. Root1455]|nr:hypothetical protein [Caulobacter sp. Root1455]